MLTHTKWEVGREPEAKREREKEKVLESGRVPAEKRLKNSKGERGFI